MADIAIWLRKTDIKRGRYTIDVRAEDRRIEKKDKTVNEPWMHPEATPQVRELIRLRYRLMPNLYDLVWRYQLAGLKSLMAPKH